MEDHYSWSINGIEFVFFELLRYVLINEVGKEFPFRATLPISKDCFSDLFIVIMQQVLAIIKPHTKICLHRDTTTYIFL